MKRKSKLLIVSIVSTALMVISAIGASAVDTTKDAFSSALSTIQSDIMGYIALVIPVGLAVFGAIIAIKKGISFVKSLLGR